MRQATSTAHRQIRMFRKPNLIWRALGPTELGNEPVPRGARNGTYSSRFPPPTRTVAAHPDVSAKRCGKLTRPMTVKTWKLAAANVAFVALVAACGDDASADVDPRSDGNGPVVAHPTEGNGSGFEALIAGTLTMSSGCLLVGEFFVVWPTGTTWDAETKAVRLSDGRSVALGDGVSGGGGYSNLADLGAQFDESLAGCRADEHQEVAMFNAGELITVHQMT